jgi:hypothetical protein
MLTPAVLHLDVESRIQPCPGHQEGTSERVGAARNWTLDLEIEIATEGKILERIAAR